MSIYWYGFGLLTFWCDCQNSVWRRWPVDIRWVPDWAGEGSVVVQRGIDQRDGSLATGWSSLPFDTSSKLTLRWEEGLRREVEKLQEKKKYRILNKTFKLTPRHKLRNCYKHCHFTSTEQEWCNTNRTKVFIYGDAVSVIHSLLTHE